MVKVTHDNLHIANSLDIQFEDHEFKLGDWGNVDFYYTEKNLLILLEVEKGQKHPNTNVVKIWPYLEENPNLKIVLVHIKRKENNAPKNRIALCEFFGRKLENEFPHRFRYIFSKWHESLAPEIRERVKTKIKELT